MLASWLRLRSHGRVRVLFVENDDSFSLNVVESLPVDRGDVLVRPGREVARDRADVVVVGSGPTDPVRAGIVGVVQAAARRRLPLLGICLGHQALGLAFGAELIRVLPVHGKQAGITFSRSRLFPSFVGRQTMMRYHSLALTGIKAPLHVIADTDDRIAMAVEHETLPMAGLQFHPDSFASPRGKDLIADFFGSVA
jgi:anthranilate synthase/aminodeoxychorismate synthase-like glutamine amidotransferase